MNVHRIQEGEMESLIKCGMFIFESYLFLNIKTYKKQTIFA
jgi:hypothetical protein